MEGRLKEGKVYQLALDFAREDILFGKFLVKFCMVSSVSRLESSRGRGRGRGCSFCAVRRCVRVRVSLLESWGRVGVVWYGTVNPTSMCEAGGLKAEAGSWGFYE